MNPFQVFISPIAGSIIGYFTNWLAIKMLFRPYTEKRIFGMKIPFTPGLIPKEKDRIAKKIGATVGEHLLSEEVLVKVLTDEKILNSIDHIISKVFLNLRERQENVDDILTMILGERKDTDLEILEDRIAMFILNRIHDQEVLETIAIFITNQIENILDNQVEDFSKENFIGLDLIQMDSIKQWVLQTITDYKDSLIGEERTLSQMIPPMWIQNLKEIIRTKLPNYFPYVVDYMKKPLVQQKIKRILLDLIQANVGKLALMFIDGDKIYEKFLQYIKEFIENEEKQGEILDEIDHFIDDIIEKPIHQWINRIEVLNDSQHIEAIFDQILNMAKRFYPNIQHDMEQWIISYFKKLLQNEDIARKLKLLISKEMKKFLTVPISQWMQEVQDPIEEKIKNIALKYYKELIMNQSGYIVNLLDIPSIVEERIVEFETDYTEKIIISVVDRELKAITWLGGLLGFIIGFVPMIFGR